MISREAREVAHAMARAGASPEHAEHFEAGLADLVIYYMRTAKTTDRKIWDQVTKAICDRHRKELEGLESA